MATTFRWVSGDTIFGNERHSEEITLEETVMSRQAVTHLIGRVEDLEKDVVNAQAAVDHVKEALWAQRVRTLIHEKMFGGVPFHLYVDEMQDKVRLRLNTPREEVVEVLQFLGWNSPAWQFNLNDRQGDVHLWMTTTGTSKDISIHVSAPSLELAVDILRIYSIAPSSYELMSHVEKISKNRAFFLERYHIVRRTFDEN